MKSLINKKILLGITGGIAAYKSAEIVRSLKKIGSEVRVVMTRSAQEFMTPLTMQALSGNPVSSELLDHNAEAGMGHIELAKWADAVLIAPCTAECISKLSMGRGDDLLTTLSLVHEGNLAIAPAMNQAMWADVRTQDNIRTLKENGTQIFGPGSGDLACGDIGLGRMLEPEEIIFKLSQLFSTGLLAGKEILITAGPTQEMIDPVRFISNKSSGKMGYAIATSAQEAGAKVTLISGPVKLSPPDNVLFESVTSADEMYKSVMHHARKSDIFISTAAVSDFKPRDLSQNKIKKKNKDGMTIELEQNKDILSSITEKFDSIYTVGFAAETEKIEEYAKKKLIEKKLKLIVANDVSDKDIGFDSDENEVTIFSLNAKLVIKKEDKYKVARKLIEFIAKDL
ncbi:MAG: bifunctional phosphopantothenoylcysteine decarboxylase/phosphopantothenate--cysteine ligase CoaBC [SAR86 cluster bacterium]|jgi:phosphopantothenoylcysteine decarboxylase / phosphopantothenate---cysteine ligase|nr:bifunctional phosphopantothenoylcysteine decarboxylase/phosphopantothenate--cysteine ligase CoaBC [SAR86 cluster bacterium]|tara:strand:- start:14307 stop:15500 length:1194 start_codon:yes stop_codon:yes gene_type:complete